MRPLEMPMELGLSPPRVAWFPHYLTRGLTDPASWSRQAPDLRPAVLRPIAMMSATAGTSDTVTDASPLPSSCPVLTAMLACNGRLLAAHRLPTWSVTPG